MDSHKMVGILLLLPVLPSMVHSQRLDDAVLETRRTVEVAFTESQIQIDGELKEPEWQTVHPANDFIQVEPREGWLATERTEIRILYGPENLYFGIYCFDSGEIVVNDLSRDFDFMSSDSVGIVIDTFNDQRNGYMFVTNPGGAKRDVQFVDEGRNQDIQWDGVWHVATRRVADGWTVEIAIPFKTLQYSRASVQTWGINFNRRVRRKNEVSYWSFIPRRYGLPRVSLAGRLEGLNLTRYGRNLKVKPYFKSAVNQFSGQKTSSDTDGGLDFKYEVTSGMTLDLTVQPDFSEAEVDTQQINLTRFSLFFPEKRDFFLENSGIFHFGDGAGELGPRQARYTRLFYSRRIGLSDEGQPITILGGARLTGRAGPLALGLLNIQTESFEQEPAENFTAVRGKWNILSNSNLGAIFLNRQTSVQGDWNRDYGLDANFRLFENLTLQSYLANTTTPNRKGQDWAGKLSGVWSDNFLYFQLYYSDIGENFNPELGFVQRPGVELLRTNMRLMPRPKNNRMIREFRPHWNNQYYTDQDGRPLTKSTHVGFVQIEFQDGTVVEMGGTWRFERLDEDFEIHPGVIIPIGDYTFYDNGLEFQSDPSRWISGTLNWRWGDHFDGRRTNMLAGLRLQPSEYLSAALRYSGNQFDLKNGSFTTHLATLSVNYSFNPKAFINALFQYNSDSRQVSSNIRFNLIHRPLSNIILVYNEERSLSDAGTDKAMIFKYTHLFEF